MQIKEAKSEAESVFKDVLSRKDRADATRNALSVLTRFKFIFFLNKSMEDNMEKVWFYDLIFFLCKSGFGISKKDKTFTTNVIKVEGYPTKFVKYYLY